MVLTDVEQLHILNHAVHYTYIHTYMHDSAQTLAEEPHVQLSPTPDLCTKEQHTCTRNLKAWYRNPQQLSPNIDKSRMLRSSEIRHDLNNSAELHLCCNTSSLVSSFIIRVNHVKQVNSA